jgi:hypothetical protein
MNENPYKAPQADSKLPTMKPATDKPTKLRRDIAGFPLWVIIAFALYIAGFVGCFLGGSIKDGF